MDLPTTITLGQFEAIDGARSAMLRCLPHEEARAESRLFSALIGALGFNTANDIPDVGEYADELVAACLLGCVEVEDVHAAA